MQEQATSSIAASSLPSSSERSSSSALQLEVKEGMESDDEIRRVPEIGGEAARGSVSFREAGSTAGPDRVQASSEGMRKRGRSPADKENKRLKRLLRNRVSAQQARERKKAYLTELEGRVKDLEKKNSELDERVSTLQNENQMLRHRSTKSFRREGSSGLVWDDKLLIENMSENPQKEVDQLMHCQSTNRSGMAMKEHGGSNGASSSFFARSFSTPVKKLRGSRKPPMAKKS